MQRNQRVAIFRACLAPLELALPLYIYGSGLPPSPWLIQTTGDGFSELLPSLYIRTLLDMLQKVPPFAGDNV